MKILILDDCQERHEAFERYHPDAERVHCLNAREAFEALAEEYSRGTRFDLAYLDHDLGEAFTGKDVAQYIVDCLLPGERPKQVIVHSVNPDGAKAIRDTLVSVGVQTAVIPFFQLIPPTGSE